MLCFIVTIYGILIESVGYDTYQLLNYLFFLRFPTIKPAPKHTPRQITKTPMFNTIITYYLSVSSYHQGSDEHCALFQN